MGSALDERAAQDDAMPAAPRELQMVPFRGSLAVASGALTWGQLRGPRWRRLLPDVYVAADVEIDHRVRCTGAVVFACRSSAAGRIAVSGLSAFECWGLSGLPPGSAVELTMPPTLRLESLPRDLRLVRSALREAEVTSFGGLPLTSPARTAFDVVRRCGRVDGIVALDEMLQRRLVSLPALLRYSLTVAGRPGSRRFADALALSEPASESPMETRCRLVIMDGGLARPIAQYVVLDLAGRFVARVDLAYPLQRVGIEYEGDHHRERATFRRDIARLNALTSQEWVIVRVTADDIYREPDELVRRIGELLERRRP